MAYTGEKKKQYDREWAAKRRAQFFSDKICLICGSKENLELDHIDPAKKTSHNIWSWTEIKRLAEIEKCQVLCSNHHQEKTTIEKLIYSTFKSRRSYGLKNIGVYKKTIKQDRYEARLKFKNEDIYVGSFATEQEAVEARNNKVRELIKDSPFYIFFKDKF